jgi:hypothetical protein
LNVEYTVSSEKIVTAEHERVAGIEISINVRGRPAQSTSSDSFDSNCWWSDSIFTDLVTKINIIIIVTGNVEDKGGGILVRILKSCKYYFII